MNQQQWDKSRQIGQYLQRNRKNSSTLVPDYSILETDKNWASSRFLAQVLYHSEPLNYNLSCADFETFVLDYESESGLKVDVRGLLDRYWLRQTLGMVKIAGTVSYQTHVFKDFRNYREELTFLVQLAEREPKKEFAEEEFAEEITQYESDKGLQLQTEGIYYKRWLSIKEGKIELSNFNYYFKPFVDYWDDFLFLNAYYDFKYLQSRHLTLKTKEVEQMLAVYKAIFPKTPSLEQLEKDQLIELQDDECLFTLDANKNGSWSTLCDPISGHYWSLLLADEHYENDEDRLLKFIKEVSYWSDYADPLKNLTKLEKKRFLDAACSVILKDQDLQGIDQEILKVVRDVRHGEIYWLSHTNNPYFNYELDNSDAYELITSLQAWESYARITYLHSQESRSSILSLIGLIVRYDFETERQSTSEADTYLITHYPRIVTLLENSLNRPSLLWHIQSVALTSRPELIPFLVSHKKLMSFAFVLLHKLEFCEDFPDAKKDAWLKIISFSNQQLRPIYEEEALGAKILWQIFRLLNQNKYKSMTPHQNYSLAMDERKKARDKEIVILQAIEKLTLRESANTLDKEYLLPVWLDALTSEVLKFLRPTRIRNASYTLPLIQWDATAWLLKVSYIWKFRKEVGANQRQQLSDFFLKSFQNAFEIRYSPKIDIHTRKEIRGITSWHYSLESLEFIEWIYPLYELEKEERLHFFLQPVIEFPADLIRKDSFIRLQSDKYRCLLSILILVREQLAVQHPDPNLDKNILESLKKKIEIRIAQLLERHHTEKPEESRVDLFDSHKEAGLIGERHQALFPRLSHLLNYFHNKEQIITIISQTQDLMRILSIAEHLGSEGLRESLMKQVSEVTVRDFLDKTYWANEVHQVLDRLQQMGVEFLNLLEQVIAFWEGNIAHKSYDYKEILYRSQLLVAYMKDSEEDLNHIPAPEESPVRTPGKLSLSNERNFFQALLLLKKQPERSLNIFDHLTNTYPNYPIFAIHRMRTRMQLTDRDDSFSFEEIRQEWQDYQSIQGIVIEKLGSFYHTQMLHLYFGLAQHDELDDYYKKLNVADQLSLENGEFKVLSLLQRGHQHQALLLIDQMQEYHQLINPTRKAQLLELRDKVDETDSLIEMRNQLGLINHLRPERFIKVLPDYLNGKKELLPFLVHEFIHAAGMMLEKVAALNDIRHEDKYNDLMELALDTRFSSWGWKVNEQSRGGFAPNDKPLEKKNPGSRDFKITDTGGNQLMIAEALIYRNRNEAIDHFKKIFNYSHDKRRLLLFTYHRKCEEFEAFQSHWDKYINEWLPATEFPEELVLVDTKEVTTNFSFATTAMRVAKTTHAWQVEVFHIMVNLEYHLAESEKVQISEN